eukprot:1270012-Karenia_brevis.AAC.1
MTEYRNPDGTVGKVNYDDNIILEGRNADYAVRDPTWNYDNTKKNIKGYWLLPDQDGFCPFNKYQTIVLGKGKDFYNA